jgi:hypothetical protein
VKMSFKSGNEESSANRYDTTFSSQEIVVTWHLFWCACHLAKWKNFRIELSQMNRSTYIHACIHTCSANPKPVTRQQNMEHVKTICYSEFTTESLSHVDKYKHKQDRYTHHIDTYITTVVHNNYTA